VSLLDGMSKMMRRLSAFSIDTEFLGYVRIVMRLVVAVIAMLVAMPVCGEEPSSSPHPGLRHLRETMYLPESFDQTTFDSLWLTWPIEAKKEVAKLSLSERRRATMARYGLVVDPESSPDELNPIGYIVDHSGGWHMNCLSCHQGTVEGKLIPGVANQQFDLQSLTEDVATVKLFRGKLTKVQDLGALAFPMGSTSGTTNAVMFGVAFVAQRTPDMSVVPLQRVEFTHHDMDAPSWWHYAKKSGIYIDGFSPKHHRVLMQFTLAPSNDRDTIYSWEKDFVEIQDYLNSLKAPKYEGLIDEALAKQGAVVFRDHCSSCHGTYATKYSEDVASYPNKLVPLDDVGTDRVRLESIGPEHRQWIKDSWMTEYGKQPVILDPQGYVAPPLDGVWASAPYFHNGAVPTLEEVLNPEKRPVVWMRENDRYDYERVGLKVERVEEMPKGAMDKAVKRRYFDTRLLGKANRGHDYPGVLSEVERGALLEYLKSL
jgi:hypothetical protein